jgi:hypothetical protein
MKNFLLICFSMAVPSEGFYCFFYKIPYALQNFASLHKHSIYSYPVSQLFCLLNIIQTIRPRVTGDLPVREPGSNPGSMLSCEM